MSLYLSTHPCYTLFFSSWMPRGQLSRKRMKSRRVRRLRGSTSSTLSNRSVRTTRKNSSGRGRYKNTFLKVGSRVKIRTTGHTVSSTKKYQRTTVKQWGGSESNNNNNKPPSAGGARTPATAPTQTRAAPVQAHHALGPDRPEAADAPPPTQPSASPANNYNNNNNNNDNNNNNNNNNNNINNDNDNIVNTVRNLNTQISNSLTSNTEQTVGHLKDLAMKNDENRTEIKNADGIPVLVKILSEENNYNDNIRAYAAGALRALAKTHATHDAIVQAGAIPTLVTILKSNNGQSLKVYAAEALTELHKNVNSQHHLDSEVIQMLKLFHSTNNTAFELLTPVHPPQNRPLNANRTHITPPLTPTSPRS